jgi:apolipoprotein N-acyltransferase
LHIKFYQPLEWYRNCSLQGDINNRQKKQLTSRKKYTKQKKDRSKDYTWLNPGRNVIVSGLLIGFSFPFIDVIPTAPFAWIGFVPLLLELENHLTNFKRFAWSAFLVMVIFNAISACWVLVATIPGALILWFPHAFINTIPFLILYPIQRRIGWTTSLYLLPLLWTVWEWLHIQSEFSFPWLLMGNTQSTIPLMIQYAEFTGVWGITLWVMSVNICVYFFVKGYKAKIKKQLIAVSVILACLIIFPVIYYLIITDDDKLQHTSEPLKVTIVQQNVDPFAKWDFEKFPIIMNRLFILTDQSVANEKPDLLVWPETAIPYYILMSGPEGEFRDKLFEKIEDWNTALLTGFSDVDIYNDSTKRKPFTFFESETGLYYDPFNSAMILQPGVINPKVYRKIKLVPFAEKVPYSDIFPSIANYTFSVAGISGWIEGDSVSVLPLIRENNDTIKIAGLICFEGLYPDYVTEFIRRGAQVLIIITNDGWFGPTHALLQHASFARIRAIETRRPLVRCGNTGISFFVDRFGRVSGQLPWWEELTSTQEIYPESGITFFVQHPDLLPQICLTLSLLFLPLVFIRKYIIRRNSIN